MQVEGRMTDDVDDDPRGGSARPERGRRSLTASEAALSRLAVRFVRVITTGLETGRPGLSTGQTELAGLRGGLQGGGARVIAEHTRVALATLIEADAAEREGVALEPLAIPALHAVIDHAQMAVARGFEQAHGVRAARATAPHF